MNIGTKIIWDVTELEDGTLRAKERGTDFTFDAPDSTHLEVAIRAHACQIHHKLPVEVEVHQTMTLHVEQRRRHGIVYPNGFNPRA